MPVFVYKPLYFFIKLYSRLFKAELSPDICLVVAEQNRGWILERYCLEIAKINPSISQIHYGLLNLPRAGHYYFSHYSLLVSALKRNPFLIQSRITVQYTHLLEATPNKKEIFHVLKNYTDLITCMNSQDKSRLVQEGVKEEVIHVLVGGVDQKFFSKKMPSSNKVLICAAFYERKDPQKLLEVVRAAPDLEFSLLGPGWESSNQYQELTSLGNIEFLEAEFNDYPGIYLDHGIFLSVSQVEGGPIPLLEAMASNLKPVCSKTGFAEDVIEHGVNGLIFNLDDTPMTIVNYLRQEIHSPSNIYNTIVKYSWQLYAQRAQKLILNDSPLDSAL
jgi:glycosyltransferase involved in cell wall biosynthesis